LSNIRGSFYEMVLKELQQFDFNQKYENIESNPMIDDCASLEEIVNEVSKSVNSSEIDPDYLYKLDINVRIFQNLFHLTKSLVCGFRA